MEEHSLFANFQCSSNSISL